MMRNGFRVNADLLSDTLSMLARKHQVPGAQLAIHQGGETLAIEVGELDHGTGRLVDRDAAFPVGSITKSFTAAVAMILVADGDLELDTPLGEYLPVLGNGTDDLGAQLTLRQLLSHTSGLSSGPDSTEVAGASRRRYVLERQQRNTSSLPRAMREALTGLHIAKLSSKAEKKCIKTSQGPVTAPCGRAVQQRRSVLF